ncbi:hypothetical protein Tco_0348612, partial [Tanacetum coccineum]
GIFVGDNIEALENVVEDEPHFFTEVIDNYLRALTMITKYFMSEKRNGLLGPNGEVVVEKVALRTIWLTFALILFDIADSLEVNKVDYLLVNEEGIFVGDNIETLENVVEDEPHFFTEVIDNYLRALTMITKYFMSEKRNGLLGPNGEVVVEKVEIHISYAFLYNSRGIYDA